jgi:uncharacterized membrane protein
MPDKKESRLTRILNTLRNQFLIGLVMAVPLVVTYLVLAWLFDTVDNVLQPVIRFVTGYSLPGAGLVAGLVLIFIIGLISSNVFGKQLIRFGESMLNRIPLVRTLYSSIKQVMENFSINGKTGLLQVVLVEYPRKGIMSIAFVTCETLDKAGKKLLTLLIPMAPNPLSGFVVIVSEEEVLRTGMKVDDALRLMITCGAVMPAETNNGKPLTNWPPEFNKNEETDSARDTGR